MTKIAIIYYSLYGHIAGFAESIKKGIEEAGATCDIYQVAETLPAEVLEKMGGPPKKDHPVITAEDLPNYDGFMFGISGRFGSIPAQLKVWLLHMPSFHAPSNLNTRLSWTRRVDSGPKALSLARLPEPLSAREPKVVDRRTPRSP